MTTDNGAYSPIQKIWDDAITVVFSCNDQYVIHLYTVINSIKMNNHSGRKYDIIILQIDISDEQKNRLKEKMSDDNLSIRFFDMSRIFDGKRLTTHRNITVETFFRYYIQDILKGYEKALYLDVDVVINSDLEKLYNSKMGNNCVLATRDVGLICQYYSYEYRRRYFEKTLKISSPLDYYQAGVVLINIPEMSRTVEPDKLIELTESKHWEFLDQDVMNMTLQGKIGFIDQSWNVTMDYDKDLGGIPEDIRKMYMGAMENPKIIHYAGSFKPWDYEDVGFYDYYRKYLYDEKMEISGGKKRNNFSLFFDTWKKNGLKSALYSVKIWMKNRTSK